jgi:Ran GTPase-activating protein (RanGAP) involved in mRNA processing and transport
LREELARLKDNICQTPTILR